MTDKVVVLHDFSLLKILNTLCNKSVISSEARDKIRQFMDWEGRSMPPQTDTEKIIQDVLNFQAKSEEEIKYEYTKIQASFEVDDRDFPIAGLRAEMSTNDESMLVRYLLFRLLEEMSNLIQN